MTEAAVEMILIALAVFIVALLVGNVSQKINVSKQIDNSNTETYANVVSKYSNPVMQSYDEMSVLGTEVIEVVNDCLNGDDSYAVWVCDKLEPNPMFPSGYYVHAFRSGNSSLSAMINGVSCYVYKDFNASVDSIEKSATYKGHVYRDKNDRIVLLAFEKKK